jgi:hypothetical protein
VSLNESGDLLILLLFARRYTPLQKYTGYLYNLLYLKVRRKKLTEKFQLKGCVTELDFGYNSKMEVIYEIEFEYTTLGEMPEDNI